MWNKYIYPFAKKWIAESQWHIMGKSSFMNCDLPQITLVHIKKHLLNFFHWNQCCFIIIAFCPEFLVLCLDLVHSVLCWCEGNSKCCADCIKPYKMTVKPVTIFYAFFGNVFQDVSVSWLGRFKIWSTIFIIYAMVWADFREPMSTKYLAFYLESLKILPINFLEW